MRIDGELMEIWPNEVCDSASIVRNINELKRMQQKAALWITGTF